MPIYLGWDTGNGIKISWRKLEMQCLENMKEVNQWRSNQAKQDLIGSIWNSKLIHLLELDRTESKGERLAWEAILQVMEQKGMKNEMENSPIYDAINHYGNETEESGFRKGFHVAMRLFVEGMNGGVCK